MGDGRKYGLLVVPVAADDGVEQDFAPGRTWMGKAADLVVAETTTYWREWLGSVRWAEVMEKSHRLVLQEVPSERPAVLDKENDELSGELHLVWRALLLAAPLRPLSGEAWVLTGELRDGERPLAEVRSIGHLGPIIRPWYTSRRPFFERMPWRDGDPWRQRWGDIVRHLRATHASLPELVRMATLSYVVGLHQEETEFRLPTFVRAAEAVLAISKNSQGAAVFAARVLKLVPTLATHWWVGGGDVEERVRQLYGHRNDCVHGKIPFAALRANGDAGADEAAMFEYLAELVARETVLFALRSSAFQAVATDRATLEDAWTNGNVA